MYILEYIKGLIKPRWQQFRESRRVSYFSKLNDELEVLSPEERDTLPILKVYADATENLSQQVELFGNQLQERDQRAAEQQSAIEGLEHIVQHQQEGMNQLVKKNDELRDKQQTSDNQIERLKEYLSNAALTHQQARHAIFELRRNMASYIGAFLEAENNIGNQDKRVHDFLTTDEQGRIITMDDSLRDMFGLCGVDFTLEEIMIKSLLANKDFQEQFNSMRYELDRLKDRDNRIAVQNEMDYQTSREGATIYTCRMSVMDKVTVDNGHMYVIGLRTVRPKRIHGGLFGKSHRFSPRKPNQKLYREMHKVVMEYLLDRIETPLIMDLSKVEDMTEKLLYYCKRFSQVCPQYTILGVEKNEVVLTALYNHGVKREYIHTHETGFKVLKPKEA